MIERGFEIHISVSLVKCIVCKELRVEPPMVTGICDNNISSTKQLKFGELELQNLPRIWSISNIIIIVILATISFTAGIINLLEADK